MKQNMIDKRASILIIGAGPAGLSAAYYLKTHGFKNVTVMERLGRVGGLCCSATEDYQSSDRDSGKSAKNNQPESLDFSK